MYFQILSLVLWPKHEALPRMVEFRRGEVNVISGDSKTGKSAVIPIIDYCLGSRKCLIPVGVVREKVAWFGIVVDTVEGKKLLARREPGTSVQSGDMFVLEGDDFGVPARIGEKNSNESYVKDMLDRLSGLTSFEFEPNTELVSKARPSFRDLTAFMFQPQNIVANPAVLFYKADTTEHREKLKNVLPYVLNVVTPKTLALRHELEVCLRKLRKLETELAQLKQVSVRRVVEGRTWLNQARELGLATTLDVPDSWPDISAELNRISSGDISFHPVKVKDIEGTLAALQKLRRVESDLVAEASTTRQRLMELKRLREGTSEFAGALQLQRERLSLAPWIRERVHEFELEGVLAQPSERVVAELCDTLRELEIRLRAHPVATTVLDAEYQRQRERAEEVLAQLAAIRHEIRTYEATSELAESEIRRTASVERFLGGLEQLLVSYHLSDGSGELEEKMSALKLKAESIQSQVNAAEYARRMESTLRELQAITSTIVPGLNVEWGDSPVRLSPRELTVTVSRDGRTDYLWEIGSGANWVAYHVAITLALQRYFISHPPSPVPGLLVYDQPSQVYFPRLSSKDSSEGLKLTDQEDIQAVRRIFKAMGEQAQQSGGLLQVIVLDHAHDEVWGGLPGVSLVEEWRGTKLVPSNW